MAISLEKARLFRFPRNDDSKSEFGSRVEGVKAAPLWYNAVASKGGFPLSWPAVAAVIFWGWSFIATKVVMKEIHPFVFLPFRFAIGASILLAIQLKRDRSFWRAFSPRDWISILLLSCAGVIALGLLQAYGLLYTSAIHTGWIIAINPILITIASRLFLGEPITLRKTLGIALGFSGIGLIISNGEFSSAIFRFGSSFGDLLVFASAIAWTAYTVGGRGFLSRFSPLSSVTVVLVVGCLALLPFGIVTGQWTHVAHLSFRAWGALLFLGICCSGLGYLFWYRALEQKDSSVVGMYLYLEPFSTLIGALLLLGEELRPITLLGGGLTLLGVYLATWKAKGR